jgi:O-succinylbenzoic acid--CoA ligase
MTPLEQLRWRSQSDGLLGADQPHLLALAEQRWQQLQSWPQGATVLLAEAEAVTFLASVIAAVSHRCRLVLANPGWRLQEWQQLGEWLVADCIWGQSVPELFPGASPKYPIPSATILIPTGGSSGQLRFAIHTWQTLNASVEGMQRHFGVDRIHSCCVLPLYHVSGLMQFMRSFITGGQLVLHPWKALACGSFPAIDPAEFFLSLVPTQLQRLIDSTGSSHAATIRTLAQFRSILLGGGPAWENLLSQARVLGLPLAPTYGMTETASQVVTLKPEEFLAGQTGCGRPLPHSCLTLRDRWGVPVLPYQVGSIEIVADSMMLGYLPPDEFSPEDLGYWDAAGSLHLVGRRSETIITGGEKVLPLEVEHAIRATQFVVDVAVLGVPDLQWGQRVAALYVPIHSAVTLEQIEAAIAPRLARYKHPKQWLALSHLPRHPQGKLNRQQGLELLLSHRDQIP